MTRLITATTLALACSVGLSAQSAKVKSETEISVKDGKNVTVTGCVERAANGTGFVLTSAEGKDVESRHYLLVGKDDSMEERVGHLVEIKGKAADIGGDGKVEVKTKTKVERENADDKETESKTEMEGDLDEIPYLGVKSVKTIRESCN
jgi:hypothetical protein